VDKKGKKEKDKELIIKLLKEQENQFKNIVKNDIKKKSPLRNEKKMKRNNSDKSNDWKKIETQSFSYDQSLSVIDDVRTDSNASSLSRQTSKNLLEL